MRGPMQASQLIVFAASLTFFANGVCALSQTWDITMDVRAPDCVSNTVILVNGEFPGPELRIQPGEEIEIIVNNYIPHLALAVHFHGQDQKGTPFMDGTDMVSSCSTGPHQSFTYRFTADDVPGTNMYHLHVAGMRHLGLYGMMITEDRPQDALPIDGEHALVLADFLHAPFYETVAGLLSTNYKPYEPADSFLFNGKGLHPGCDPTHHLLQTVFGRQDNLTKPVVCEQQCPTREVLRVRAGGMYRLRLGSLASQMDVNIAIENHTMTVIEADGRPIMPIEVTSLDIGAGQRYSVLINTDQRPAAYHISVGRYFDTLQRGQHLGRAVLLYDSAPHSKPHTVSVQKIDQIHSGREKSKLFGMNQSLSFRADTTMPIAPSHKEVTKRWTFNFTTEYFHPWAHKNHGHLENACNSTGEKVVRNAINRAVFQAQHDVPVSLAVWSGDTAALTPNRGYYGLEVGDVVEVVLQNFRTCEGVCSTHPWHLHGHHFWVIGQGQGLWTASEEQVASLVAGHAVHRDTITVPGGDVRPGTALAACGWTMIRFKADNPGAWPFHCHWEWHAIQGMNAVFWYTDGSLPDPPADLPCRHKVAGHGAAVDTHDHSEHLFNNFSDHSNTPAPSGGHGAAVDTHDHSEHLYNNFSDHSSANSNSPLPSGDHGAAVGANDHSEHLINNVSDHSSANNTHDHSEHLFNNFSDHSNTPVPSGGHGAAAVDAHDHSEHLYNNFSDHSSVPSDANLKHNHATGNAWWVAIVVLVLVGAVLGLIAAVVVQRRRRQADIAKFLANHTANDQSALEAGQLSTNAAQSAPILQADAEEAEAVPEHGEAKGEGTAARKSSVAG